jgi:hypothetical protein
LVGLVAWVCLLGSILVGYPLVHGAEDATIRAQAQQLTNEAVALSRAGNVTQAEQRLQQVLALVEQADGPGHLHVVAPLHRLADFYKTQRRWGEAEPLYQRALHIRETALGPVHPTVVESLGQLAALQVSQDPPQAYQLYDRARRLALDVARVNADLDDTGLQGLAQQQRGFLTAYLTFLADGARALQGKLSTGLPLEEAFIVAEQYRSGVAHTALARAGIRAAAAAPTTAVLARQVQDLRTQRQAAHTAWLAAYGEAAGTRDPAHLAALHLAIRTTEDALAAATARLRAALPAYDALVAPEPLDLATVATLLRPDEALGSFFTLDTQLLVWLVRPGQAPVARAVPITRTALLQQVAQVRASLDQRQNPALTAGQLTPVDVAGAHALYTLLLAPLRPALAGVHHLLLVPDAVLLPCPLALL